MPARHHLLPWRQLGICVVYLGPWQQLCAGLVRCHNLFLSYLDILPAMINLYANFMEPSLPSVGVLHPTGMALVCVSIIFLGLIFNVVSADIVAGLSWCHTLQGQPAPRQG